MPNGVGYARRPKLKAERYRAQAERPPKALAFPDKATKNIMSV